MPPKGHAILSASSSERWLNCPPSARLCENYEDKGSDYAAEGTDAHTLCEYRLKQALGIPAEDPIENLSWYNEEMEECATGYAAYVVELMENAKQACTDPRKFAFGDFMRRTNIDELPQFFNVLIGNMSFVILLS